MYEALLKNTPEYQKTAASLASPGPAALFGLPPAGRALLYAALQKDTGRILCVVTPGEAEATHFADDLKTMGLSAAVFPPRDFMLRPVEGAGREYEYRRLSVLGALAGGRLNAVCVPAEALLQYTVPQDEFQKNTLTLKPGMVYNREALVERLFAAGYVRRSQVDGPGQFSVRGDIVDIYAPDMRQPARVEYWDDEIDSLASFDLLTQRRDSALEKIYLSPAREVLFGSTADTAEALRAAQKKARGKRRTALEKAMESDLAQLDSGVMPEAMDKYYGLRYETPATLLDHLSSPIFILDEVGGIRDAQKATEFRRSEELTGLLEEGVICPGLDVLYQTMDDLTIAAQDQSTLLCENFLRGMNEFKLKDLINAEAFAAPNWGGDLASLREDLDPLVQQGYAVALFAGTPKGAAALTRDLADKGYAVSMSRDVRPAKGLVQVLPGHLTAGCTFPFARVAVISSRRHGLDDEAAENKKRKKNKNALSSLSDIKPGDYVVHQSHGIGMYAGIQRLEVQGAIKDYLKIQYSGSDVLYVPVTQLDLLSRYTAPGDEEKVKLAKLGGTEWQRTRAKVKKATEEMAQELIELYARRRQATGYAFPADGEWQSDFESRFEYDETDDQLTATAEIKKDMEKGWPMDRLLCGDVGVGKTEVAFRAAFKCVMGGKQCAILAPTTLLAWQHYNSIISRMEAFPVKVGLLSRFRTAKQQKETLRGLQAGSVDIVIGTHRLLSKDVRFHDLGLVIIDEEQRFGVKHKEKLKENFIGVDMLTLSATPIPRTLNMAMSGIRDLSTIEQPPIERQPVETFVLEYNDVILAEAMKKELARGGQVYYLHNRVDNIESCAAHVSQMVPGARVGIAHGKMTEEELNPVWQHLLNGEIDILVCTTLIETGIDVRNCNTLIIEDADRMGLAQLYQIRGRVGRSGRKAYAYFTFRRDKTLTDIAQKRLSAIREFTAFGSGFRIAMRDLQIRGAGSLLGHSQHGHMEAVGYDLYVKMLGQAIARAKGEPIQRDKSECLVDLRVDAFIPEKYIADGPGRIEAYKRIAAIQTPEDAADVLDELIDRYGDPPPSVSDLVNVSLVRVQAAAVGVYEVTQKKDTLLLQVETLDVAMIRGLLIAFNGRVTAGAGTKPYLSVTLQPDEKPLELLQSILKAMADILAAPPEENTGKKINFTRSTLMKKKLIALVCALALAVGLVGCSLSTPDSVGTIGNVDISSGLYLLAQFDAYQTAADLASDDQDATKVSSFLKATITVDDATGETAVVSDYVAQKTLENLESYAAIETRFDELGGVLTLDEETQADSYASQLMEQNGDLYKANGIGLDTLKRFERILIKSNDLLEMCYGTDGETPVSDAELTSHLEDEMVYIRYVVVPLYNTSTFAFADDDQSTQMLELAQTAAESCNAAIPDGASAQTSAFSAAVAAALPDIYAVLDGEPSSDASSLSTALLGSDNIDSTFSEEGTADVVRALKPGEAAAVQYSSYALMMLVRLDPLDADTLDSLRAQALSDMKSGELQDSLQSYGAQLPHALDSAAMKKMPASKIKNEQ